MDKQDIKNKAIQLTAYGIFWTIFIGTIVGNIGQTFNITEGIILLFSGVYIIFETKNIFMKNEN